MSNQKTLLNQLFTNLQPPCHTVSFKHSKSQYLLPDQNQSGDSKLKRFQRTNDYSNITPKHKVKMLKRSTVRQDTSMRQLLPDNHQNNNLSMQSSKTYQIHKIETINKKNKNCSFFQPRMTSRQQVLDKKRSSSIFSRISDKIEKCVANEYKGKLQKPQQLDKDTFIFSNQQLMDQIKTLNNTIKQYQIREKNKIKQIQKLNKVNEQLLKIKQQTLGIKKERNLLSIENLQLKNKNLEIEKILKKLQIEKGILLKNNAQMAQAKLTHQIRDLQSFREASLQHQVQELRNEISKGKSTLQLVLQQEIKSLKSIKFEQQRQIKALEIKNTILHRKIQIAQKILEQSEYDALKAEEHKNLKETFSSLVVEYKKLKKAYEQLKDEHKKLRKKCKKMKRIIFGENRVNQLNDEQESSQAQIDLNLSYSR